MGVSDRRDDLGTAELEVLKVLWDHGASTVRDVLNLLHARGRRLAYTTVLTFLSRLEQKGYVASNKRGLAYVYRAKISREKVTRSRLKTLISELFDGAAGPLAAQLIAEEHLSREEIESLQALLDRLECDSSHGESSREEA